MKRYIKEIEAIAARCTESQADGYSHIMRICEAMMEEQQNCVGKSYAKIPDEGQGVFLRLPCKVGDKVYIIVGKDISKQTIQRVTISSNEILEFYTRKRGFAISDIGKKVFLTREEAETKLKEMED